MTLLHRTFFVWVCYLEDTKALFDGRCSQQMTCSLYREGPPFLISSIPWSVSPLCFPTSSFLPCSSVFYYFVNSRACGLSEFASFGGGAMSLNVCRYSRFSEDLALPLGTSSALLASTSSGPTLRCCRCLTCLHRCLTFFSCFRRRKRCGNVCFLVFLYASFVLFKAKFYNVKAPVVWAES